ncbi:MAG: SUMF1/EgtB/PvdO family nonheme iron enzyme [Magnetococcales bacterium]|nr:SUMF1/EgtB/PvdO family nonheme iron enzyme [Magnetococcales bacterium]
METTERAEGEKDGRLSLADAARLIGHVTPRYRVVRALGRGAYGQVFLAEDDLKQVAVKILPLALRVRGAQGVTIDDREESTRDWIQLRTAWERLHHAALVRVHDYFQVHEDNPDALVAVHGLIVMDYWPLSLRECVRRLRKEQADTPARKRALLVNLAETLSRLRHDTGLLVTDLKPDNIVLRDHRRGPLTLALIDIGSLVHAGATDISRVDRADGYLAPELADKKSTLIDEAALIYSFGLIGYLILEGEHPFAEEQLPTPYAHALRQRGGFGWSHTTRQNLPGCVAILERCLREEPRARFPSFAALARALRRERAAAARRQRAAHLSLITATLPTDVDSPAPGSIWHEPVAGVEFVWIPPGDGLIGQSDAERAELLAMFGTERYRDWFASEQPRHRVVLDGFWLGRVPITRGQWERFVEESLYLTDAEKSGFATGMGRKGWGRQAGVDWRQPGFAQDPTHPVVCISWYDALAFAAWLGQGSHVTYTLPTEAQWEYACRAGSDTPFHFGPTLDASLCNYDGGGVYAGSKKGENRRATTAAGQFPANAFGLHDMHGNVWEWCADCHDSTMYDQPAASTKNPQCRERTPYRVRRGGAWSFEPVFLRSAYRGRGYPEQASTDGGLRLVATFVHGGHSR